MKTLIISLCLFISLLHIFCFSSVVLVSSQCLEDQQTLLLQLKSSLEFEVDPSYSSKLVEWNETTKYECCHWPGVTCDSIGRVTSLNLENESITGGIDSSSSLFQLKYLQSLNLAYNDFNHSHIPSGFSKLTSLTYLNLSHCFFAGQIPVELASLTSLVTLDLSSSYFPDYRLTLENPNLSTLLMNLTGLTALYLDRVDLSANAYNWSQVISSSLPNLKQLSLCYCLLSGPLDSSLRKLQSLSVFQLSGNNLSVTVPDFFADFKNLTVLRLDNCHLIGEFPKKVLIAPNLTILDLSGNGDLGGSLPEFPKNGSLETMVLSHTNFSGSLRSSVVNLGKLARMDLRNCSFIGPIPNAIANLTELVYLDLSSNKFTGPMPLLPLSNNLVHIYLSSNSLSGPIPSNHFEGLHNLESVDLTFNLFNGSVPSSLFVLSSLQTIGLSNNYFDGLVVPLSNASSLWLSELDLSSNNLKGPIPPFFFELKRLSILSLSFNNLSSNQFDGLVAPLSNPSSSWLSVLDLRSNNLKGPIPPFLFKLKRLSFLSLSFNLLNGTVKLQAFHAMVSLTSLDLSYNNLSVDVGNDNSSLPLLPSITRLNLASCNLESFTFLKNRTNLNSLDLSANRIGGELPNWLWGNQDLTFLNLSHNLLVNLQEPYDVSHLAVLDLHANQLSGKIPPVPQNPVYVDYSTNHFNSSLPTEFGHNLRISYLFYFSVSNNMLTGTIPDSICKAINLQVLDLSNNSLSSRIPSCLKDISVSLSVLNLANNNLSGKIPPVPQTLRTLDLHGNHLEGEVPKSLARCSMLEVLNLGKNQINDTFPCFLKKCTNLRVLTLRSNMLHGNILCIGETEVWPKLQIIDLASNYFTGHMSRNFLIWRAMRRKEDGGQLKGGHLQLQVQFMLSYYYVDTLTVVNKGFEMELVKIQTIFTAIDFSNNRFSGEISSSIGELKALYVLNMSHNTLTGSIPASIGNLRQLGSLDLSVNNLAGKIPTELTNLTFLSFLNLSCNRLEGRIPQSTQLQTFTETSFGGNKDLCGFQLNKSCSYDEPPPPPSEEADEKGESIVELLGVEVGFIVGLAAFVVPLLFSNRWSRWYYKHFEEIVISKVCLYFERRNRKRRNPVRRLE